MPRGLFIYDSNDAQRTRVLRSGARERLIWGKEAASLLSYGSFADDSSALQELLLASARRTFREAAEKTGWQPVLPRI